MFKLVLHVLSVVFGKYLCTIKLQSSYRIKTMYPDVYEFLTRLFKQLKLIDTFSKRRQTFAIVILTTETVVFVNAIKPNRSVNTAPNWFTSIKADCKLKKAFKRVSPLAWNIPAYQNSSDSISIITMRITLILAFATIAFAVSCVQVNFACSEIRILNRL